MKLSKYEMETIVNYNLQDEVATIYTRDFTVMKKLDALVMEYPAYYRMINETEVDKTYEMTKNLINFRRPTMISKEHREWSSRHLKKMNNKRNKGSG